jgi:choline/glycine/proline betaine transport protein
VILDLNPSVFVASSVLIALFVIVGIVYRVPFAADMDAVQTWVADRAGWLLVLTVNAVLGYLLYLLVSPFGTLRLGGAGARPEFGYATWIAMLFSAGMGIGLLYYGVAEPIFHLSSRPLGAAPGSVAAYRDASKLTFLHWGLHAWGVYTLAGLALGYAAHNRGEPLSVRSAFVPLFGRHTAGWPGDVVDVLATVATLFGVATSLGLGVLQINAGLERLFGVPTTLAVQIGLITAITAMATTSVVLGLDKGIKWLSVVNMWLAAVLLAVVFATGPSLFILNGLVQDVGAYLGSLVEMSFWTETYTRGDWQNHWTVFYWAWWISWSPFVGLFMARTSVGRTVREFIGGALLTASLLTFVWLAVFGNSALFIELAGPGGLMGAVQRNLDSSLFVFLDLLPRASGLAVPGGWVLAVSILTIVTIVSFFVTSSDSGSLVIDIITAGGHTDPPVAQRVYWATAEGVVAAVLLAGGGLAALQTAAISAGLPFAIVILLMIVSLHRAFRADAAPPV